MYKTLQNDCVTVAKTTPSFAILIELWFSGFVLVFYSNTKDYKLNSAPKAPKRKIVFSMSQFAGNTITKPF